MTPPWEPADVLGILLVEWSDEDPLEDSEPRSQVPPTAPPPLDLIAQGDTVLQSVIAVPGEQGRAHAAHLVRRILLREI